MVPKTPLPSLHLLALIVPSVVACTAELDELKVVDRSEPVTSDRNDLDEAGTTGPASSSPDSGSSGSSETSSTDEPTSNPETPCAEGLLNSDGFCVPELRCAPGTFITTMNGSRTCAPCPSGSYSEDFDSETCVPWRNCELGTFVVEPGSSTSDRKCKSCPEGESTTVVNAGECSGEDDCPPGTYENGDECVECAPGSYCSGKTDYEVTCPEGMWDDDLDPKTPCVVSTSCAAGQRVLKPGSPTTDRRCEYCDDENWSDQINATSCKQWTVCEVGSQVDVQGTRSSDRSCKACPEGTFADEENAATCTAWNTCSAPTHYQVAEGSDVVDRNCRACPAGYASETDNASSCKQVPGANLVGNPSFESGIDGWSTWDGATLSAVDTRARTGKQSLLVTGSGTGPAATTLEVVNVGATYRVTFWVSVGKVSASQVNLTRKLECGGTANYQWLTEHSAVPSSSWTNLTGSFTVPSDCATPKLTVYAEGSNSNVDLYVDDVSIIQQ